jgi:hypothetical protein
MFERTLLQLAWRRKLAAAAEVVDRAMDELVSVALGS